MKLDNYITNTEILSPAAFGAYVRLLLKLDTATPRGEIGFTTNQLSRLFGASTIEETEDLITEITNSAHSICEHTKKKDHHYFTNQRMKREAVITRVRSEAGKLGAAKTNMQWARLSQVKIDYDFGSLKKMDDSLDIPLPEDVDKVFFRQKIKRHFLKWRLMNNCHFEIRTESSEHSITVIRTT